MTDLRLEIVMRSDIGGPYPKPASRMPALWAASQKMLSLVQPAYDRNLFVNDCGYIECNESLQQVLHRDLQPRAVAAGDVALSVFVVLTPCPRDGVHGSWVVGNTFVQSSLRAGLGNGCAQVVISKFPSKFPLLIPWQHSKLAVFVWTGVLPDGPRWALRVTSGLAVSPLTPERCWCNSHLGTPSPWVQVPFPEEPSSVTVLHSLTDRARGIFSLSPERNSQWRGKTGKQCREQGHCICDSPGRSLATTVSRWTSVLLDGVFGACVDGIGRGNADFQTRSFPLVHCSRGHPAALFPKSRTTTTTRWCRFRHGRARARGTKSVGVVVAGGSSAAAAKNAICARSGGSNCVFVGHMGLCDCCTHLDSKGIAWCLTVGQWDSYP